MRATHVAAAVIIMGTAANDAFAQNAPPSAAEGPGDPPYEGAQTDPSKPAAQPSTDEDAGAKPEGASEPASPDLDDLADDDDDDDDAPRIPPAPDRLGGHVLAAAGAAWMLPFAKLEGDTPQSTAVAGGPGFALDVGYAISRVTVVGLWGQLGLFGGSDDCSQCDALSIAAGPSVTYHLVQGLEFDPWMSYGLGIRSTSISGPADVSYFGVEWARLRIGGDWYPTSVFGFGPFIELDLGTYFGKSAGNLDDRAVNAHFLIGGRIALDIPGR